MNIEKLIKKSAIFIFSSAFMLSLFINVGADPNKLHAAPHGPAEHQLLEDFYGISPWSKIRRPFDDFLPALSVLTNASHQYTWHLFNKYIDPENYNPNDGFCGTDLWEQRLLKLSMAVSCGRIPPAIDANTFCKRVREFLDLEKSEFYDSFEENVEKILNEAFPDWKVVDDKTGPEADDFNTTWFLPRYIYNFKPRFRDLAQFYFNRIDAVGRPRVLIVGSGRFNPAKSCITLSRCFPDCTDFLACGCFSDPGFDAKDSYDERYYGKARWNYLLLDKKFFCRPDICMDIDDAEIVELLGENEWDYIINECVPGDPKFRAAERLLKPGGKLLHAYKTDLSPDEFDLSEGRLGKTRIIYEKPKV